MARKTRSKRNRIGHRSVFVRCAGIAAIITIVVATVLTVQSMSLIGGLATQGVVDRASREADQTAAALVKPLRFNAERMVVKTVIGTMEAAGEYGSALVVVDAEGAQIGQSEAGVELHPALVELANEAMASGAHVVAEGGLWVAAPVFAKAEGPVVGAMAMAWNADSALAAAQVQKVKILVSAAVVFATMMVGAVFLFQRVIGRPLRMITGSVERIAAGNFSDDELLLGRRDEFGAIGVHLAAMTESLRAAGIAEEARAKEAEYQADVVTQLGASLNVLAEGVLNQEIDVEFKEDYAALRDNYNRAVRQLRDLINEVAGNTHNLLDSANSIAASSDELSSRTETQAATLEESAAALEELLNSVNSASEGAKQAEDYVAETREIAERNGAVMKSAIDAMGAIEKSSEEISDITNVIDDIAFQTNLLALNAGVEAARAGKSGKGFAVVATEVRGLAQRSADAAQRIKALISGAGEQINTGVRLVEEAGGALDEVLDKVAGVSGMVSTIAASAGEQATGLKEINVGISNLDRVTQQNAAMVGEATSSAHTMRENATSLNSLISRFDTTDPVSGTVSDGDEERAQVA